MNFVVSIDGRELFRSKNRMESWRYAYAKARDLGLVFNYDKDAWVGSEAQSHVLTLKPEE